MTLSNPPLIEVQQELNPFVQCRNNDISLAENSTTLIAEANPERIYAIFINTSKKPLTLILGNRFDGSITKGIPLNPGGSYELNSNNLYRGPVSAVCVEATTMSWVECNKSNDNIESE